MILLDAHLSAGRALLLSPVPLTRTGVACPFTPTFKRRLSDLGASIVGAFIPFVHLSLGERPERALALPAFEVLARIVNRLVPESPGSHRDRHCLDEGALEKMGYAS